MTDIFAKPKDRYSRVFVLAPQRCAEKDTRVSVAQISLFKPDDQMFTVRFIRQS